MPRVLAADIGGTKANLALFEGSGGRLREVRSATLPSTDFASLENLVEHFTAGRPAAVEAACFGIAGTVSEDRASTPNLPWSVDRQRLEGLLGLRRVLLINDLVATGYGIAELEPAQLCPLREGRGDPRGCRALVAAGTGLGEAFLTWSEGGYVPHPSEGGHTDFGPLQPEHEKLRRFLAERFGRVSYERLVSGPGLLNIYRYLVGPGGRPEDPSLGARLATAAAPAVIAELGAAGADPACGEALDWFVRLYGAEAGNLALKVLATGGVFLGGGIAPQILGKLQDGIFMEAFVAKGRLAPVLREIPVHVILEPRTALLGAARRALAEIF